nr:hypothetical protein [Moorena bouillonii]
MIDLRSRYAMVQWSRYAIAYSMDTLIPGLYLWLGPLSFRIGGVAPEENYPGTIHGFSGLALVLPGYRIYSTYQGSYDPLLSN